MADQSLQIKDTYRKLSAPFWVLFIFSFLTISGLVLFVTHNQNQKAIEASVHLAKAVIASNKRTINRIAVDYGFWDQAVTNLVDQINLEWADENIGTYLYNNGSVTSTYVVNADNAPVYSSEKGVRVNDDPLKRFSGGLDILIRQVRSGDPTTAPEPAFGFVSDLKFVYFSTAVRMTTYFMKDGKQINKASDSVLILTKKIDTEFLETLTTDYLLYDLNIIPPGDSFNFATISLHSADQSNLGKLAWKPTLPGDLILPTLIVGVVIIFILMAGTAYIFVGRASKIALQLSHAKAEAENSNKIKSQFIANMNHELRTPLTSIKGALGLINSTMVNNMTVDQKDLIEISLRNSDAMHLLINELLDYEKIHFRNNNN